MSDNPLEAKYAEEVSKRLGFQHYPVPSSYTSADFIPAIVWRTECSISYHHSRSIENPYFLGNVADYYMGGQFGDISSGGHIRSYMYEPIDSELLPKRAYLHYAANREALHSIFTDKFLNEYLPQVKKCFADSFKTIEEKDNINIYQVWDQKERQANFILRSGMVHRHIIEGIYPFLDVEYFNFVSSVPEKWRKGQLMYRAVINHLGPEVRGIPSANDGLRLRSSLFANRFERWIGYKKAGLLKRIGVKNKPTKTPHFLSNDEPSINLIRSFLKGEYFDPAIFNSSGIEDLLKAVSGSSIHDRMLKTLATFAVGLPIFVYKSVNECPGNALPYLAKAQV